MKNVKIGKNGLYVPAVGYGAWQAGKSGWGSDYTDDDLIEAMRFSIKNGSNLIDTAEVYGMGYSEKLIADAIKEFERKDYFIATKVNPPHFGYEDVLKSCEGSLKRLGLDYVDLYQLHWPDDSVPISETMKAMEKLADEGKIKNIGVSNFPLPLLKEAMKSLKNNDIVSNQVEYSLLRRDVEKELKPFMDENGMTVIAYSPLAKGILTGKYNASNRPSDKIRGTHRHFTPENFQRIKPLLEKLKELSAKYDASMGAISLSYLVKKGAVVIPGAKNRKQVEDNVKAGNIKISGDDERILDELSPIE